MNRNLVKWGGLAIALVLILGVAGAAYAARQAGGLSALVGATRGQQTSEPGIVIVHVPADSPAAQAGLQRGDILLKINDTAVNTYLDLFNALSNLKPGDKVTLAITRGGVAQTLTATLGDQNSRAYLGVGVCGGGFGRHWGGFLGHGPGAYITSVVADSPAAKAGLQVGDRIIAVDGTTVDATNTLANLLGAHKPGDTVTLRIARPGQAASDVTVTLGDQNGKAYLGVEYLPFGGPRSTGFQPGFALPQGVSQGVFVISVADGSPAASAGLKAGDVITQIDGQAVGSPSALSDAIAAHKPGDKVTLKVYRSADQQTTDIQVTLGARPDDASKAYLGVTTKGFFRGSSRGRGGEFGFPGPFRFLFPQQQAPSVQGNEA